MDVFVLQDILKKKLSLKENYVQRLEQWKFICFSLQ